MNKIVKWININIRLCVVHCVLFVVFPCTLSVAQGVGGYPLSAFESKSRVAKEVIVKVPDSALVVVKRDMEGEDSRWNNRIGVAIRTEIDVLKDGEWTEVRGGEKICRLRVRSEGAVALSLKFDNFEIGRDSRLFVYNEDMSDVLGAFTKSNNGAGALLMDYIVGSSLIIEFNGDESDLSNIKIDEVAYFYRGIAVSGSCQVNVACPEGDNYRDQINSVVQIVTKIAGSYYNCSGTLINNTNQDKTPYVLTAYHCAHNDSGSIESSETDYDSYRFAFNYQYTTCKGNTPERKRTLYGAKRIATSDWKNSTEIGSDFLLLKLNEQIPDDIGAYFSGWDRTGLPVDDGVSIHHPSGDYKKISTFKTMLTQGNYPVGGYPMGFFGVKWAKTESGFGTTEGGSSGSGLFRKEGMLIGTLTGGASSCRNTSGRDYYSMFSKSWDSNGKTADKRLSPWLDPNGSGDVYILSGLKTTAVETLAAELDVRVYPNPASDYVVVELPDGVRYKKAVLFDITGRELACEVNEIEDKLNVDIRNVKTGVCFLKVYFDDNRSKTIKIGVN